MNKPKDVYEAKLMLDEIRKNDPDAYYKLRCKCKWEHMTLTAVLREWGDPREWK